MTDRIVVIGSNSFTGATFVDVALRQNAAVLGMSRSAQPAKPFLPHTWNGTSAARFDFARLDLNRDTDEIARRIEDFRADYVVNFAAQSMVAESWQFPD